MRHTIDLTAADFLDTLDGGGLVLIDFWAPWCGPCKVFGPTFEEVAAEYPDATFAKVNTQQEQEIAAALNIRSIPTLMIVRDGVVLGMQAGLVPAAALRDMVRQAQALDMDEVRAQAAAAGG